MLQLAYCNLWTYLTFGWCFDVMKIGYQRPLQGTDLRKVDREWYLRFLRCELSGTYNSLSRIFPPFFQLGQILGEESRRRESPQYLPRRRYHSPPPTLPPPMGYVLDRATCRQRARLEDRVGSEKTSAVLGHRRAVQTVLLPGGAIQDRRGCLSTDGKCYRRVGLYTPDLNL